MPDNKSGKDADTRRLAIMCILIALSIVWAVVEWVLLPDIVVMQMSSSGVPTNTMPKIAGIAVPFAISVIFAVVYKVQEGQTKHLLLSVLGLVLPIVTLAFNL